MSSCILLVDDDPDILALVSALLTSEGFETVTASSMAEMLRCLESRDFDLFVLDMNLPDGDGVRCCSYIRGYSQAPILMLTAQKSTDLKVNAFEMGADDYIVKPFDPRELAARVKVQLRRAGQALTSADTATDPLRRATRIGRYKVVRELGKGGTGTVLLVEELTSKTRYAMKVLSRSLCLDDQLVSRFKRESNAHLKLNHPNLVSAIEAGEEHGQYFYVMEYCQGTPLSEMIEPDQLMPINQTIGVIQQAAHGLAHAHANGIIHRDIKPGNILITQDGTAKILDLGLVKNLEDDKQTFVTETGIAVGTACYISPEQANGDKDIDGRTDVYSLGVTMYHLLTGEPPFHGSVIAVVRQHVDTPLPDPRELRPGLSDELVRILNRMTAKKRKERYERVPDLIADLEAYTGTNSSP